MTEHIEWPVGEEPAEETSADQAARDRAQARTRVVAAVSLIAIILVAAPILIWIL